jgi:hypothetical protein
VAAQVCGQRLVAIEAREPQARAARIRRGDLEARVAAHAHALADLDVTSFAQLHDPPPVAGHVRRLRRNVEQRLRAVLARGRQRRGQGGRRVDDNQVAWSQEPGQIAELRVLDPAARALGHHEADLVALQAARLGRCGGLEGLRELEGDGGSHAAAAVARSCAR